MKKPLSMELDAAVIIHFDGTVGIVVHADPSCCVPTGEKPGIGGTGV